MGKKQKQQQSIVAATAAATVTSVLLYRSVIHDLNLIPDLIPEECKYYIYMFRNYVSSLFIPPRLTMVIQEYKGIVPNQIFEAAEIYLGGKINPTTRYLNLSKAKAEDNINLTMEGDEELIDYFDGVQFKWKLIWEKPKNNIDIPQTFKPNDQQIPVSHPDVRYFYLTFPKQHKDMMLNSYLPYLLEKAKSIKEAQKTVKLYASDPYGIWSICREAWKGAPLKHPSTFDTIALDAKLKKTIMDDLDVFVKRKDFYKNVGKAWKRGYLLYGPPGTGKSSLIAAMANYLNFDIYDLDLTELYYNSALKKLMLSTANRSILVIEDVDCSIDLQDRESKIKRRDDRPQVTLSAVLNFLDGLWSSCGDEKIIILTTNHKDKLDPALLRPGRMDMHINLSYCTPDGFNVLAQNYLGIDNHPLFQDIENMLLNVQVTPAEVAEQFMKPDSPNVVIQQLLEFIEKKKIEQDEAKAQQEAQGNQEKQTDTSDDDDDSSDEDSSDEDSSDEDKAKKGDKGKQKRKAKKENQTDEEKKDIAQGTQQEGQSEELKEIKMMMMDMANKLNEILQKTKYVEEKEKTN